MIILDTNVVSETVKHGGSDVTRDWLNRQVVDTLYLTSVSLGELMFGVEVLPEGKRKNILRDSLTKSISMLFGSHTLPFEQQAAMAYGLLVSRARSNGYIISVADGQIAAIASVHKFVVASRDTAPFEAAGIRVINPWTE